MQKTKIIREIIGTRIEPYGFKYLKTDGPCRIFVREVTGVKRYYDPDIQMVRQYINIQESRFSKRLIARLSTEINPVEWQLEQIEKYDEMGWLAYTDEDSYRKQLKLIADLIVEYGFDYLNENSIEEEEIQTKAMEEKLAQEFDQLDREFIDEYHLKSTPEQAEDIDEWFRLIKQLIADNAERPYDEVKDLLVKIAAFIGKRDCELLKKHWEVGLNGALLVISGEIRMDNRYHSYLPLKTAVRMWRARYEDPDMTKENINRIMNEMKQFLMMQNNPEEYYGKELSAEVNYQCTEQEAKIGNMMVAKALAVAQYTGKKQGAIRKLGVVGALLDKYYYFNTVDEQTKAVDFQFITCKINGIEGHVWVEIKMRSHDENVGDEEKNMISLWYLEYRIDEWYVVKILDTPWINRGV